MNHGCGALTPDQDYDVAQRALAEGDLPHAVHHLGGALAGDHENERYLRLADAIARRAPEDVAPLFPEGEHGLYFGAAAVKAWILASRKDAAGALSTLLQVAAADPAGRWLSWAARWLLDDDFGRGCDTRRVAGTVVAIEKRLDLAKHPALLDEVVSVAAHLARQNGAGDLALAAMRLLRASGQAERAVEVTAAAEATGRSYGTAVAHAGALKAAGRHEDALGWFRTACERDPSDEACRLDVADTLADLGRNEEAIAAYEDVLGRVPDHPWALPSALYGRAVVRRDEEAARALDALARAQPGNDRARQLAAALRGAGLCPPDGEAYVDYLPRRTEAVINILRQLVDSERDGKGSRLMRLTLDALEAPSAFAAMKLQFDALGWPFDVDLTIDPLQQPDPRLPRARGWLRRRPSLVLWTYDGVWASPTLPAPPGAITEAVCALARRPFSLEGWWHAAGAAAARLDDVGVEQVAAALVHPAPVAKGQDAADWVFAQQLAAALVLARRPGGVALLEDVLLGPMDWTCGAAALALALACAPGDRARRHASLLGLLKAPPSHGFWCLEAPLAAAARLLCDDGPLRARLGEIARR